MSRLHNCEKQVWLGSYDKGKPRIRILIDAAHLSGFHVIECNKDIWIDVEDKSQNLTMLNALRYGVRWLGSRPRMLARYLKLPKHQSVVFPYPGIADLLLFYPFVKLRGAKIFLDMFISVYDTVVNDRKLVDPKSILAKVIFRIESLAGRCADVVFLDTPTHAAYVHSLFNHTFDLPEYVPVGVEKAEFRREGYRKWDGSRPLEILFYGQFVPLQGTLYLAEAIAEWARHSELATHWTVIGIGQDSEQFDHTLKKAKVTNVQRIRWVKYVELQKWIAGSDVCLGIFGTSEKALNVIPNKVYQVLAVGRPILTANTPGIRSLIGPSPAIELVKPGDSQAIVHGLRSLADRLKSSPKVMRRSVENMPIVDSTQVGKKLASVFTQGVG